ncbi:MAG: S9 family peptidase [Candidatus Oleimicrobiaceae bacterium]
MRTGAVLMVCLLLWWGLGPASGQAQRPLTSRDAVVLSYPEEATISPDGNVVVFTLRQADFAARRFTSHLWLVGTDKEAPRQLTAGNGRDWAPSWSPDAQFVAFLSDRSLATAGAGSTPEVRLWVIPTAGGEASCVSDTGNVLAYRWAQDGKRLYYLRRPRASASSRSDPWEFGATAPPDELWMTSLPEGRAQRVATLHPDITGFDLSQEAQQVAYCAGHEGAFGAQDGYTLYVYDLQTGQTSHFSNIPGSVNAALFSPDGLSIACLATPRPEILCSQSELAVIDAITGRVSTLTGHLDLAVDAPLWARDGKSLYVRVAAGTSTYIYQVFVATRRIVDVVRGTGVVTCFTLAADGLTCAYIREDARTLPEIYLQREGKAQKLTDFSAQLVPFSLGSQTVIRYQNEGYELDMVVVYPVGYVAGIRCPVLLFVHDGPYGRFVNTLRQDLFFQVFANRGYLVAAPNPRGSAGYTDAFAQASRLDIGGGDYRDLMAAVMYLDDLGIGDFMQMGIIGVGYGGYMVNWAVTQTDRFRAAVSMGGTFNLTSHAGSPHRLAWDKTYLGTNYWADNKPYLERSPAFYAKFIDTPVLLLHGENDPVACPHDAMEMSQVLKAAGKRVELVLYPREGHTLNNEPEHVVDWMERVLSWFDRHLLAGERLDTDAGQQP